MSQRLYSHEQYRVASAPVGSLLPGETCAALYESIIRLAMREGVQNFGMGNLSGVIVELDRLPTGEWELSGVHGLALIGAGMNAVMYDVPDVDPSKQNVLSFEGAACFPVVSGLRTTFYSSGDSGGKLRIPIITHCDFIVSIRSTVPQNREVTLMTVDGWFVVAKDGKMVSTKQSVEMLSELDSIRQSSKAISVLSGYFTPPSYACR